MKKYDPFFKYLNSRKESSIVLTYEEIERIISDKLPMSAHKYKVWWDNNSHVQSRAWRDAGYKVDSVIMGVKVFFIKE